MDRLDRIAITGLDFALPSFQFSSVQTLFPSSFPHDHLHHLAMAMVMMAKKKKTTKPARQMMT